MATRLGQSFDVHGFDVNESRRLLAAREGVSVHESARLAAAEADVVLIAVRNEQQLIDVLFGPVGVVDVLTSEAVVVLTSTVGMAAIPETAMRLDHLGISFVDAPLSGGAVRAAEGDLLILVGGTPQSIGLARSVLDSLSSTLTIVGDRPGDGQALKTVNQLLCGVHIAAAAEALALADALGLKREAALEALELGAAGSFMLSNRGPRMLAAYDANPPEVMSRLDIFVKDLGIVGTATRSLGLAAPVSAAAEQLFLLAKAQGLSAEDDSAVIRAIAPKLNAD
ncbi:NAD(P)-dependent oxidoreductase [Frondihabitans peucedani]|uniref:NAD(P)-dependent oxidoreductase n=2 Tax=Frondihabitans peucedani TaxID=598626 RepID=A0ABP8E575_9MICO